MTTLIEIVEGNASQAASIVLAPSTKQGELKQKV